ncbi:hypothetical protein [Streptomyces sviceus]|uniref:hypothetical protein n=1 Tax=Streptomyces TaxID=1883 RepID=UPI0009E83003|nr:hypothetical protein [Streptomyces sviceus]MYT09848.1 hypothetical protein [Streptomyces sp. SID5470]
MTLSSPHPPRRRVLRTGLGLTAAAGLATLAVPSPASASTRTAADGSPAHHTSANRLSRRNRRPTPREPLGTRQVPGSSVSVALRIGEAATVLVHVIRRYHYEIDTLVDGEVIGFRPADGTLKGRATNHASGTAVAIRPTWYPDGAKGGLFPHQLATVRDILKECQDVVAWGGDFRRPNESHFQIDVAPSDARLKRLAARIRGWEDIPGQGAGTLSLGA